MKKLIYILIPMVLLLITCKNSLTSPESSTIRYFDDYAFDKLVRKIINKPSGLITQEDLDPIIKIEADGQGIGGIKGIENCKNIKHLSLKNCFLHHPPNYYRNIEDHGIEEIGTLKKLEYLDLSSNYIRDISFLTKLTNLKFLGLENTYVSKIHHLKNLKKLKEFRLSTNGYSIEGQFSLFELDSLNVLFLKDISYVWKFYDYINQATNLTSLSIVDCSIRNIAFVENLKSITKLILNFNNISDISILTDFTNLNVLYLNNNNISDLKPLVDNPDFKMRDGIKPYFLIYNNPLSEQSINEYIPALEARGIDVYY